MYTMFDSHIKFMSQREMPIILNYTTVQVIVNCSTVQIIVDNKRRNLLVLLHNIKVSKPKKVFKRIEECLNDSSQSVAKTIIFNYVRRCVEPPPLNIMYVSFNLSVFLWTLCFFCC